MKISSLADCPHLAPVIAQWHFGEWGHLYPGGTVDGWLDHIRARMNADRIPMTVVAWDGEEPVGTAALTEHDMETHRELSPWLGGVYVIPPARRSGVASALVRNQAGLLERHTLRSSVWKHMPAGWLVMFHQGTPTEAFVQNAT